MGDLILANFNRRPVPDADWDTAMMIAIRTHGPEWATSDLELCEAWRRFVLRRVEAWGHRQAGTFPWAEAWFHFSTKPHVARRLAQGAPWAVRDFNPSDGAA